MPSIFLTFFIKIHKNFVKNSKNSKNRRHIQAICGEFGGILGITTQMLPGWNLPSSKLPILAILTYPCLGYFDEIRHAKRNI